MSGCDGIPQLPSPVDKQSVSEDVVTAVGRGGYDWFYTERKFDVVAPSEAPVFDKLDRAAVVANFPAGAFVELSEPYRPDGMDDDVYETFSRLSEPHFDTKPYLEVPFSKATNGMFAISADGNRLAMLGEHLEVWDLTQSKIVEKHSLPSDTCNRVGWRAGVDELMVMDRSTVYCISASTGETLHSWKPPVADTLTFFAGALNSPVTVVSTAKGRMYVIDQKLQTTLQYAGEAISSPVVAIRPDALWVLAQVNSDIIRWHLDSSKNGRVDKLGTLQSNQPFNDQLIAGSITDYIMEPYEYARVLPSEQLEIQRVHANFLTHATCLGTRDFTSEWLTSCLSRPNKGGGRDYFLQDLLLGETLYSLEFPLGSEPVLEVQTNLATEVCVVRDAQRLRVYHRKRWKDVVGRWTLLRLGQLAVDGRFEQLELAAQELRKMQRTRIEYGESLYANIANNVGYRWAEIEMILAKTGKSEGADPTGQPAASEADLVTMRESILALENWKASGSEMALVASAFRHYEIGYAARGKGYASTVTQASWDEFEKRIELAMVDVRPLLRAESPSCAALRVGIIAGGQSGSSIPDQQTLHKKFLENYPFDARIAQNLSMHMLPRWGGSPGEAGAYVGSVADLLPQPQADIIYARTVLAFYQTFDRAVLDSSDGGFSSSRVMRSVVTLMEHNELNGANAEDFIGFAIKVQRFDLAAKIAEYHARRFTLSKFLPRSVERQTLVDARKAIDNQ